MSVSELAGQLNQPANHPSRFRRSFPVVFTLVTGIGLTLATFAVIKQLEHERIKNDFETMAITQARALNAGIRAYDECLYSLRNLFVATDRVHRDEFHLAATDLRSRLPGIYSLRWLPLVGDADRDGVVAMARAEFRADWEINDGDTTGSQPIIPAERRERYLPALYTEPPDKFENILGFDELRGPNQRALQRAIDTGRMSTTRRVKLDGRGQYGWISFLPVYENGAALQSEAQRWSHLKGVVEGIFDLRVWLTRNSLDQNGALDMMLTDETPATTEPYILSFASGTLRTTTRSMSPPPLGLSITHPVICGGREWKLHVQPTAEWIAVKRSSLPYVVLTFGLWLTSLLSAFIHHSRNRAETVARLVEMRTAQLDRVQEQLREDVVRRREAEDRYRAFVQHSTEAIWRYELDEPMPTDWPEERQIEYIHQHAVMAECNDVCAQSYGFERSKEIIGKRLRDLLPLDDPRNHAHVQNFVRSRYRIADSETHEIDVGGQMRVLLNNVIGVVNEAGMLVRTWGTQRDITDQRRMEQARSVDAQRLRIAVAAASLGLWEWDFATDTMRWNEATHTMFGFKPGEFDGSYGAFLRCVHPDDRARISREVQQTTKFPGEFEYEYRIIRPDGTERWILSRGDAQVNERGRVVGMVGAALDITAHKVAETERTKIEQKLQEAQKLESLGVLAGGIAHDFNNLLTGILGNASLARMDLPSDSPLQHNLAQVEHASQRAADLCKQMLAYSGQGRFVIQLVNLSHLVDETASLLQVSISKDASLRLHLAEHLPPVTADATQLRQILMNLVINASDAIGDRSGVIDVRTGVMHADREYLAQTHLAPDISEGAYVYLEVTDNGSGMSVETQRKIFDPFFTTKFTGRGLGLAAVLGIVRGHQGALKVESVPMKGTTFRLLLPPAEGVPQPATPSFSGDTEWRGSGRILVIDDEETVRMVISQMLRGLGFEPVTANDGKSGLRVFASDPTGFAGVFLDLTMPRMDGAQTFAALRRLRADVRVALMSGYDERKVTQRFAGKGIAGFLQKPFTPQELGEILRRMLEPKGAAELSGTAVD